MKKVLYGVVGGLFAIILCAVLVFFGFEKKIPENWVEGQRETVKESKLDDIKEGAKDLKVSIEVASYTKDGEKTVTTYTYKADAEIKYTKNNEDETYNYKRVDYDENGSYDSTTTEKYTQEGGKFYKSVNGAEKVEITDFAEVTAYYNSFFNLYYTNEGNLKSDVINMIENHLDKVTQKGMNITFHMVDDNNYLNITFSLTKNRIVQFESITDTYVNNALSSRVLYKFVLA